MKFKFCGNHECPEWILSEIVILSKISSIKLRVLSGYIVAKIKGAHYDIAKLEKLCLDGGLTAAETKSALAVIEFVIRGAAKFQVDDAEMLKEIEQLGLPHECSESLVKAMSKDREALVAATKNSVLRLSKPLGVDYEVAFAVATDELKAGTKSGIVDATVALKLTYNDVAGKTARDTSFAISKTQLGSLLTELRRCQEIIDKVEL